MFNSNKHKHHLENDRIVILTTTIMFLTSKLALKLVEVKVVMEAMGVLEVQLEVSRSFQWVEIQI